MAPSIARICSIASRSALSSGLKFSIKEMLSRICSIFDIPLSTVTSPSFTILNVYDEGSIPLYHFDWYRLNGVDELYEMGMDEYLGGDGVAVVEWPSRCPDAVPECRLDVTLMPVGENEREITLTPCGGFREITMEAINE